MPVKITDGRIQVGGDRKKPLIADYILVYKGVKLAVVEAKSDELEVGEGVAQAKLYAQKLNLETTYATNGNEQPLALSLGSISSALVSASFI
jgi:type I restriction enzyme R subunit